MPYTTAVQKKTNHNYAEGELFSVSHFSVSSLCAIEHLIGKELIVFTVLFKHIKIQLAYSLVEDGNATQVTVSAQLKNSKLFFLTKCFVTWFIRRLFKSHLKRLQRLITNVNE